MALKPSDSSARRRKRKSAIHRSLQANPATRGRVETYRRGAEGAPRGPAPSARVGSTSQGPSRNEQELKKYGFVGASERSNARARRRREETQARAPQAKAVKPGEHRAPTKRELEQQRREAIAEALRRTGVFDVAERSSRFYDDRSIQGRALRLAIGPAGEAGSGEKAILAASAFPLFRPIRGVKAALAGARALRGGTTAARAAAKAAYRTPTAANAAKAAVRKVVPKAAPKVAPAVPKAAKVAVPKPEAKPAAPSLGMVKERVPDVAPGEQAGLPGVAAPPRVPPRVPPGRVGAAPAVPDPLPSLGNEAEIVRGSLGPARARRAAQEGGYRTERGKRIQAGVAAEEAAGGGVAGYQAKLAELRGELPKVEFAHLREGKLSQGQLDNLFRQVSEHPDLSVWDKLHAQKALLAAFEKGRVPQKSQIKLLRQVFGDNAAKELEKLSLAKKAGRLAIEALNVPRSLMASFDVSAPFRQAFVAGAHSPGKFFSNFVPMFKALGNEKAYQAILDDIHARPNFDLYQEAGVKFTELGRLEDREEMFMSNLAEKIPGAGRVVRASGRAYTGFLDKMRADVFDALLDDARAAGYNVEDKRFLQSLAKLTNSATGRGSLGPAEDWAPALNGIFFAPRLIASRVNFLDPTWYMRLDPFARKQAMKAMIRAAGAGSTILTLAGLAGAQVGLDPRNADFAKMRIGDTRIDVLGGFQQYIRLISQLTTGKLISSTTGKTLTLGHGYGELSRKDILERFAESKFNPPVSFVNDFFKGTDFEGKPFDVKKATLQRIVPLVAQDATDLYRETGNAPLAVGGYGIAAFGIGMQTYPSAAKKAEAKVETKHKDYGKLILEGAIKTGLLPKGSSLTPQLTKALDVRAARYANREKAGADDTRSRFEADVRFLEERGIIDSGKADKAVDWAHDTARDYLVERELRRLSDWYFDDLYGDAIADARQKLRDRGYDLPKLR